MIFNIQLYSNSAWVSLANYAVGDPVPFISSNRDFTPIAESLKQKIFFKCPVGITQGDDIQILKDGKVIFGGFVSSKKNNYESYTYDLEISHDLMKLENYLLEARTYNKTSSTWETSTFHTNLVNTVDTMEYNPTDSEGYSNLSMIWLLKTMFTTAGLTLDTSEVEDEIYLTILTISYLYRHIAFDRNMLYNINQPVACNTDTIDENYSGQKITLWKLFTEICSHYGFGIIVTAKNQFKLIFSSTNYTIDNDDKHKYLTENIQAQNIDVSYDIYLPGYYGDPTALRAFFYSATQSPLVVAMKGGFGEEKIDWMNNLCYYLYHTNDGVTFYPDIYILTMPFQLDLFQLTKKYNAKTKAHYKEDVTTVIKDTEKVVLKNFIDIKNRSSEIEQESEL